MFLSARSFNYGYRSIDPLIGEIGKAHISGFKDLRVYNLI